MPYVSSQLSSDAAILRERTFSRWMSRGLLQAASDFCKNIGLCAIYCECAPDAKCPAGSLTRYLFWSVPINARIEVRSGRTKEQFAAFDHANIERNLELLTLHVSEGELYSAVWISPGHMETAAAVLAAYGISPALRPDSE